MATVRKAKAAAAAELDAIQAQLERSQSALAESILAKLGAAGSVPGAPSSQGKKAEKQQSGQKQKDKHREQLLSGAARSTTLGLGAVAQAQDGGAGSRTSGSSSTPALNEADVRLRGRLVSKRKRGHDAPDSAAARPEDDGGASDEIADDEEAGRSKAVSRGAAKPGMGPANDIFASAAKKQKKAASASASDLDPELQGLSKAQRKKLRKKARLEAEANGQPAPASTSDSPSGSAKQTRDSIGPTAVASSMIAPGANGTAAGAAAAALTPLQKAMSQKLSGARFRTINETLYTQSSAAAVELMQREPSTLADYHSGFREQVKGWPKNPVDVLARRIASAASSTSSTRQGQLSLHGGSDLVVADLGAGEAPLQAALHALMPAARVLSYDLLTSPDGRVVGADCARFPFGVPLPGDPSASGVLACVRRALDEKARAKGKANGKAAEPGSQPAAVNPQAIVDAVVFCLSLMPTNWVDMIWEARRILREGGELYIAEVASRFNTLDTFISILERSGFKLLDKDDSNTHFTLLHLRLMKDAAVLNQWKADKGSSDWEAALVQAEADPDAYRSSLVTEGSHILKPCLYKRR